MGNRAEGLRVQDLVCKGGLLALALLDNRIFHEPLVEPHSRQSAQAVQGDLARHGHQSRTVTVCIPTKAIRHSPQELARVQPRHIRWQVAFLVARLQVV